MGLVDGSTVGYTSGRQESSQLRRRRRLCDLRSGSTPSGMMRMATRTAMRSRVTLQERRRLTALYGPRAATSTTAPPAPRPPPAPPPSSGTWRSSFRARPPSPQQPAVDQHCASPTQRSRRPPSSRQQAWSSSRWFAAARPPLLSYRSGKRKAAAAPGKRKAAARGRSLAWPPAVSEMGPIALAFTASTAAPAKSLALMVAIDIARPTHNASAFTTMAILTPQATALGMVIAENAGRATRWPTQQTEHITFTRLKPNVLSSLLHRLRFGHNLQRQLPQRAALSPIGVCFGYGYQQSYNRQGFNIQNQNAYGGVNEQRNARISMYFNEQNGYRSPDSGRVVGGTSVSAAVGCTASCTGSSSGGVRSDVWVRISVVAVLVPPPPPYPPDSRRILRLRLHQCHHGRSCRAVGGVLSRATARPSPTAPARTATAGGARSHAVILSTATYFNTETC